MASFTLGAIGSAFFGPLGGIIGTLVGGLIDQALFGTTQEIEGPRLSDRNPKGSKYGTMIPLNYGTDRHQGFTIYAEKIKEVATEVESGGKGGGPSVSQTTYSYFGTWGSGWCEGPQSQVLKIFMNKKLIYDFTADGKVAKRKYLGGSSGINSEFGAALSDSLFGGGLQTSFNNPKARTYLGTETQFPDPRIQAQEGINETPAHRGLCWTMFRDIPLEDFGNAFPQVEALVYNGGVNEKYPGQFVDRTDVKPDFLVRFSPTDSRYIATTNDFEKEAPDTSIVQDGFRVWDFASQALLAVRERQYPMTLADRDYAGGAYSLGNMLGVGPHVTEDGLFFYTVNGGLSDTAGIFKWSVETGQLISTTGTDDFVGLPVGNLTSVAGPRAGCLGGKFPNERYVFVGSFVKLFLEGVPGTAGIDPTSFYVAGDMPIVDLNPSNELGVTSWQINGGIPVRDNDGHVWLFGNDGTITGAIRLFKIDVYQQAIVEDHLYETQSGGADEGALPSAVGKLGYHPALNAIILNGDGLHWRLDLGVRDGQGRPTPFGTTVADRNGGGDEGFWQALYASPAVVYWNHGLGGGAGDNISGFNPYTMELVDIRPNDASDFYDSPQNLWGFGQQAKGYDPVNHALYYHGFSGAESNINLGYLDRVTTPDKVLLQSIVEDLSQRIGVEGAEINASELTDLVTGYSVRRRMSARAALEPLQVVYAFDAVESDYVMKFPKRGRAVSATIVEDELAARKEGGKDAVRLGTRRTQEVELPQRIDLVHIDPGFNYQENTQHASRAREATSSKSVVSIEAPVVLTPSEAREAAARLLYVAHLSRNERELLTGLKHISIDPTDVFNVTVAGDTLRLRAENVDLGGDLTVKITARDDDPDVYEAPITGGDTIGPDTNTQETYDGISQWFWIDGPMLRNEDDALLAYIAAGPLAETGETWNGATVLETTSQTDLVGTPQLFVESARQAVHGTLEANVTGPQTTHWDRDTVLQVRAVGALESKTEVEVLNGANMLAIQDTNGDVEYVQFATALDNGDGTWDLTDLIWGRRGTDWRTPTGHFAGERWALLTEATARTDPVEATLLNTTLYHWALTNGGSPTLFIRRSETYDGNTLRPYKVAQLDAAVNGSDIDVTWKRRSRINGGDPNVAGPMVEAETLVQYEIDVIDENDESTLRTEVVDDVETFTYTAAMITADAPVGPVRFEVYQMNATVGRGFQNSVTSALP